MTDVVLSREIARQYTDGETRVVVEAGTMRSIVRQLDERYPGLKGVLSEGMAVAIDGTIFQDFFLEDVGPDAEQDGPDEDQRSANKEQDNKTVIEFDIILDALLGPEN